MRFSFTKALLIFSFLLGSNQIMAQTEEWDAPKESDTLTNPFKGNPQMTLKGKELFKLHCTPCHGMKGKGDGMARASLEPRPKNLLLSHTQSNSDGALFWKITNGHAPMPAFQTLVTAEQRWQLINYLRELNLLYSSKEKPKKNEKN